jgi:hypothetical protein
MRLEFVTNDPYEYLGLLPSALEMASLQYVKLNHGHGGNTNVNVVVMKFNLTILIYYPFQ